MTSLVVQDKIDMYKSYLISTIGTILMVLFFCFVLHLQIWGLLLSQLIMQSIYNYWYWIKCNLRSYCITTKDYIFSLLSLS
ncbi:MAG: hypothetical protein K0R49_1811 [Burkholderiales bacterium]|nr:hypothetical protein [Burkholderiales bacterium]